MTTEERLEKEPARGKWFNGWLLAGKAIFSLVVMKLGRELGPESTMKRRIIFVVQTIFCLVVSLVTLYLIIDEIKIIISDIRDSPILLLINPLMLVVVLLLVMYYRDEVLTRPKKNKQSEKNERKTA